MPLYASHKAQDCEKGLCAFLCLPKTKTQNKGQENHPEGFGQITTIWIYYMGK